MKSLKYIFFAFVISFIALSNINAEVCIYKSDGIELRCTLTQGTFGSSTDYSASCAFTGSNIKYGYIEYDDDNNISGIAEDNYRTFSRRMTLRGTEFMNDDGSVDCSNVSTIYMDFNTISATTTPEVYDLKSTNSCEYNNDVYNFQKNVYLDGSSFRGCKALSLNSSQEGGGENVGFPDKEEDGNQGNTSTPEFDADTFCTGPVQGVFTTLGWVFFFLKILVPIMLIVFGSIDFGKAMLSNKDDGIKKSAKTLVMRAIAGVIIFFIPTILEFIVSMIDDENIYNGTFTDCTQCMLDPMHEFDDGSTCRRLVEN